MSEDAYCDKLECDQNHCECGGHYIGYQCGVCGDAGDPDPYGIDEDYQRYRWQQST